MQNSQTSNCHINLQALKGQFLAASPFIPDVRFEKKVIFICESNNASAFGFIIDPIEQNDFKNNFKKMIKGTRFKNQPIYSGGPVDSNRLFLLHSNDVLWPETLNISCALNNEMIAVTNLTNVLKNASNMPKHYILISGYTNWVQNQLSREISLGFWLIAPMKNSIIFDQAVDKKWKYCMDTLKINTNTFSRHIGTS